MAYLLQLLIPQMPVYELYPANCFELLNDAILESSSSARPNPCPNFQIYQSIFLFVMFTYIWSCNFEDIHVISDVVKQCLQMHKPTGVWFLKFLVCYRIAIDLCS